MEPSFFFVLAADAILLLHVLFVAFVLVGLTLIFVGNALAWSWVRNPWFRIAHLAAIGVVVIQSWFGVICPLTTWEMALRSRAGDAMYSGSFISHWLETLLYYQATRMGLCRLLYGAWGARCCQLVLGSPASIY